LETCKWRAETKSRKRCPEKSLFCRSAEFTLTHS